MPLNALTPEQRTFLRTVRDETIDLSSLLHRLNLTDEVLTAWLKRKTFRVQLEVMLRDGGRRRDLELTLGVACAKRRLLALARARNNPREARLACALIFRSGDASKRLRSKTKSARSVEPLRSLLHSGASQQDVEALLSEDNDDGHSRETPTH